MSRFNAISLALASAAFLFASASAASATGPRRETDMIKIQVVVGDEVLPATLDDTPTGRDFAAMLPLELTLEDYHGIEKVADLPRTLNTSGAPGRYEPKPGDITLYAPWGNLAIFYKPFPSSRGLVRLGAFDGPIDALLKSAPFAVRIQTVD